MAKFSVQRLKIPDVLLITPKKFSDSSGYFMEVYNASELAKLGVTTVFVQDNHSLSTRTGTIRGLHFQTPPHSQTKLVRVLKGAIFDVAVDLRRGSPTYGQWCGARLTAEGAEQVFIPSGFAHGYCALEPDCEVTYKVDRYYAPDYDQGLFWSDPDLGIEWPYPTNDVLVSEKDARLPRFINFVSPFNYEPT